MRDVFEQVEKNIDSLVANCVDWAACASGEALRAAEAGKLMAVMGLGVKCGQTVEVEITGEDEDAAYEAVRAFFEKNL